MLESSLIKLEAVKFVISREICKMFKSTLFYRTSLVAASEGFSFPACNFVKKVTPEKMFGCEFCKIFRSIFSFDRTPTSRWLLLVFICEFWDVFHNTSFLEHLGETAILCTSCRISTTRYSKKLFHRCFSSILYQIEKYPFEGIHLLKIPENCLWRS